MELFPSKSKSTSEEEEEEEEEMIEEEELKYIQLPSNVLIPQDIVRDIVDKVIQMMDFSEVVSKMYFYYESHFITFCLGRRGRII